MKKIIFVVFVTTILFPFWSSAQLNEEDPESNEINYVTLTFEKSKEYLDTLKSALAKIDTISEDKKWEYNDFVTTKGKIVDNKLYILRIDNKNQMDDGSIISQIVFYVMNNDLSKEYYPMENVTFYYNHKSKKGLAIWVETYSKNDPETHNKTGSQIKTRIDELMKNINKLFL